MKWSETSIGRALALQFFNRKYLCVVPNCNWTGYECDMLTVTENLRIIDVEIKISRADLKADAKKDKWWKREYVGSPHCVDEFNSQGRMIRRRHLYAQQFQLREWPPKVWKHYYALPKEIWTPELLDALPNQNSGILLLEKDSPLRPAGYVDVTCLRRAMPNKDAKPISPAAAVNIARLASLRMWDAYQRLDGKRSDSASAVADVGESMPSDQEFV